MTLTLPLLLCPHLLAFTSLRHMWHKHPWQPWSSLPPPRIPVYSLVTSTGTPSLAAIFQISESPVTHSPFHTLFLLSILYDLICNSLVFLKSCKASLVAQRLKCLPAILETGFGPWVGKMPWRRKCQPTPVFLPRESHRGRSLVGYSPWGLKESNMTERLHFVFICFTMLPSGRHKLWEQVFVFFFFFFHYCSCGA